LTLSPLPSILGRRATCKAQGKLISSSTGPCSNRFVAYRHGVVPINCQIPHLGQNHPADMDHPGNETQVEDIVFGKPAALRPQPGRDAQEVIKKV